jgi:hypothetical protein
MSKKTIGRINDKLEKVNESYTVNMYDNGYMLEISGRDNDGDYKNAKILVKTVDELVALVKEAAEMTRDE